VPPGIVTMPRNSDRVVMSKTSILLRDNSIDQKCVSGRAAAARRGQRDQAVSPEKLTTSQVAPTVMQGVIAIKNRGEVRTSRKVFFVESLTALSRAMPDTRPESFPP
jgi:hypothetical protein